MDAVYSSIEHPIENHKYLLTYCFKENLIIYINQSFH